MTANINDTIVAISTPLSGESGIGIVRISGKQAVDIGEKIFTHHNPSETPFDSHRMYLGHIHDRNNQIIDEVLFTVMYAPKTYTREDIVEISGHGGPIVLRKILELCIESGARLAEPGEFTKRAFLNGRIDLPQAEAVADLIQSKTEQAALISSQQLKGVLSSRLNELKSNLVNLIAQIEVSLDYSQEDIDFIPDKKIVENVNSLIKDISVLQESSKKGRIYREGIKLAIVGKTNVGKSSLLNLLLAQDRAIVTPVPGTTRDVITETFNLKGIPVTVMDTAGIRAHKNIIEKLAIERTKEAMAQADIIIFLTDISLPASMDDKHIWQQVISLNKKVVLVLNKIDLIKIKDESKHKSAILSTLPRQSLPDGEQTCPACRARRARPRQSLHDGVVTISALYNKGLEKLENTIYKLLMLETDTEADKSATTTLTGASLASPDTSSPVVCNVRHEQALVKCRKDLDYALESVNKNESGEFIVLHLKNALNKLGEIIGQATPEDILGIIFSRFCIGK